MGVTFNPFTSNFDFTGSSSVAWGSITGTLSSQTDLQTALNLKAPLASPTFTGVPLAPTATALTSNTQIATTAYADTSSAAAVTADAIHLLKAGDTTGVGSVIQFGGTYGSTIAVGAPYILGTSAANAVSGAEFMNTNAAGNAADTRFAAVDTTGHYIAFSMPGVGNALTLFGSARTSSAFIFNNNGTARNLTIGTLQAKDLVIGTNNTERGRFLSTGEFSWPNTIIHTGQLRLTPPVAVSATGSVATTTRYELVTTGASAITRTLYTPVGNAGAEVYLQKIDNGAGAVTVATAAGSILGGGTSLATQFKHATYISDGTNWYVKDNN